LSTTTALVLLLRLPRPLQGRQMKRGGVPESAKKPAYLVSDQLFALPFGLK
jgi:hypothetical protein